VKSAIRHDGVPTIAQFAGAPGPVIVIDTNTGAQYWLAAGDVVTTVDPWSYDLLGADESNSTKTFADTSLTFTAQANTVYEVVCFGAFTGADPQFNFTFPSGTVVALTTTTPP
jgi:hypothetical protein